MTTSPGPSRFTFDDTTGALLTTGGGGGGGNVNITGINGSAPALSNPLPVELSDGTNATGTAGNPLNVKVIGGSGGPTSQFVAACSSTTPLGTGGVFTGSSTSTTNYASVVCENFANLRGTLEIQFSADGVNWDVDNLFNTTAGLGEAYFAIVSGPFFRVLFTNTGGSPQATFRLNTYLRGDNMVVQTVSEGLLADISPVRATQVAGKSIVNGSFIALQMDETSNVLVIPQTTTALVSNTTPLGSNATLSFSTGGTRIARGVLTVVVASDQASATNGLTISKILTGTPGTSTVVAQRSVAANTVSELDVILEPNETVQISYTNGATAQGAFNIQTYLLTPTGILFPKALTASGNLSVGIAESLPTGTNTIGAVTASTTFNAIPPSLVTGGTIGPQSDYFGDLKVTEQNPEIYDLLRAILIEVRQQRTMLAMFAEDTGEAFASEFDPLNVSVEEESAGNEN